MANKNQMRVAVLTRKEQKAKHVKVDSSFGSKTNMNKSRKDYRKVSEKARTGNG